MYGQGEAGATINLMDEEGTQVAQTTVAENGSWSIDISNLNGTPLNDNEFFTATQTDVAGNVSEPSASVHYWHGSWSGAITEDSDDFVMSGSGNDTIYTDEAYSAYDTVSGEDANNSLVIDGGNGRDTVVFGAQMSNYTFSINENGHLMVAEGDAGDVTELRNVEVVTFADGSYGIDTLLTMAQDNSIEAPIVELSISAVNVVTHDSGAEEIAVPTGSNFNNRSYLDSGSNDTTLNYQNINRASFDMGKGDDTITVSQNANNAYFDMGRGDDTLVVEGQFNNASINMGSDNDYLQLDNLAGDASIAMGSGSDVLKLAGTQSDYGIVDQGNGNYQIVTGNFTRHDNGYAQWITGGEWTSVSGVEAIVFGDGTFVGDAEVAQEHVTPAEVTYEYTLNVEVRLGDEDGSETLSDLRIDTIPEGTTLKGYEPNEDGSYSIAIDEEGESLSLVLVSQEEQAEDALAAISVSVTATETNGGATATTVATVGGDASEGIAFDNLPDEQPAQNEAEAPADLSDILDGDNDAIFEDDEEHGHEDSDESNNHGHSRDGGDGHNSSGHGHTPDIAPIIIDDHC